MSFNSLLIVRTTNVRLYQEKKSTSQIIIIRSFVVEEEQKMSATIMIQ